MTYLFFYENYNIYKTEQLCANLYRLMEMILISRNIKATAIFKAKHYPYEKFIRVK